MQPFLFDNFLKIEAINETDVAAALAEGSLLLTATPQLATDWKRRLVSASAARVVATPAVEEWRHWLAALSRDLTDVPVPLSRMQELLLWEGVIRADHAGHGASARGLARHASAAYALIREYCIDRGELNGCGDEAEALERWISSMQRELTKRGRILSAELPDLLIRKVGSLVQHRTLLLDGFNTHTPLQLALLQALDSAGVVLRSVVSDPEKVEMTLTSCADAESEYLHVAVAIAGMLKETPDARIGVVTSRQVTDSELLRRILNQVLLPDSSGFEEMQAVTMAGLPLTEAPVISQLMHLLQMVGKQGASFADLSHLLFSPGLKGYAEERLIRAAFDAHLRENNRHYLTFKSLLVMQEMQQLPLFSSVLKSLLLWSSSARSAAEWVKAVHQLLQTTGFLQADTASGSNSEVRQLNAFKDCLASLVAVDSVSEKVEWSTFLTLLRTSCNEATVQLPAHYRQVAVVPLESVPGLKFDILFAVGFDEDALPQPASPASLLPLSLQRKHRLPGATAAQAYADSCFLWQQVQQAAPVVSCSFACSREERQLRASPMLADVRIKPCNAPEKTATVVPTEVFDDAPAVPLSAEERIRGGAAIIKNQSACPFRAFATHRLNIRPLGEPEPGIDAASKGSLIHLALEFIWTHLHSHRELLALDDAQTRSLIDEAIEHAWSNGKVTVTDAARSFETSRMANVLLAWLETERARPPFEVACCEKEYCLRLPETGTVDFPVRLKADRIDRDGDGHKILIDYKSGQKQSIGKWIGERMAEPQLPLYSMAESLSEADAVCFARVRSGDMGFEGLSGEKTGINGIAVYSGKDEAAEEWEDLLDLWRQRINLLAAEFVAGRSEVSPRSVAACDYCYLEAVCRIDEIGFEPDAGEGEA
ncbi:putative DNA repair protein [Mariprofundus ferrinatatus]|uniref:Putative DNA repair protein n=1 Tax=Mariprofundus ferrinatatus TaxID=1921087 RepID=A0A2K8L7K0_9PROT|nr:PD-(D/E)XK nuclease family protein [Mariprofundus ferrinatatus]ATX81841.1 putative DNA repair protein [Mariprofundus ferrinatatus]